MQRRRTSRKRSDPSVVRVRLKDQQGSPRWATAYLSDVTEDGVGLSLMTPLQIGSMVVIRGNLDENRTDVQLQADVKWCTERSDGVFQAGLQLSGGRSAGARNDRQQTISGDPAQFSEDPEELDCYEIMQVNPKAHADTIHRVHRILAQRCSCARRIQAACILRPLPHRGRGSSPLGRTSFRLRKLRSSGE